ncbi:MAG: PAS domain-containing protein [Rhodovibrio sp.]|nr:PAS domain-containing protein [Rhodovibrio sp.]
MEEVADYAWWSQAGAQRVSIRDAQRLPEFAMAWQVYQVWSRLSCAGLPARSDVDPLRFGAKALPNMALIDLLDGGRDYRWRLSGERVSALMGTRLTGKRLSELEAQVGDAVLFRGLLDQVTRYRAPRFYGLRHSTVMGAPRQTFGVLLPLRRGPSPAEAPAPVSTILSACALGCDEAAIR